jgi:di/tripeptidase
MKYLKKFNELTSNNDLLVKSLLRKGLESLIKRSHIVSEQVENNRFFYTFGKDNLNKLIQSGKEYMTKNGITEQDVEYMSWDLE